VEFGTGSFAYLQPDGGWGFSNAGLVTDGGEHCWSIPVFRDGATRALLDGFQTVSTAKIGTWSTRITMATLLAMLSRGLRG